MYYVIYDDEIVVIDYARAIQLLGIKTIYAFRSQAEWYLEQMQKEED